MKTPNPPRTLELLDYVYLGMRLLVLVATILFALSGDWVDAIISFGIFTLMMTPSILTKKYSLPLPLGLEFTIVLFIFLTLFLGSLRDFYERFHWWDGLLHFGSGILLGMLGFVLVYMLNSSPRKSIQLSPGFVSLFAVMFSLGMSVFWEIYEYTVDNVFGFNMQESGLPDTMGDFIVNAAGAVLVATLAYVWMKKQRLMPFVPKMFIHLDR